jgi:apolipoprotein D and lipocalin family protein
MDAAGDGRLRLSRWLIFHTKYWVIATGPTYEWALVGNPNHKSLWVLSKTATMQPDTLAQIEAKAAAAGFSTARLVKVAHRE